MATFTERLALLISAKDDGATRTLTKLGGASAKAGAEVDKTTKKVNRMSTGLKVGIGVAAGIAARKLLQFSGDAVKAASDLAETQNKANVVFDESIGKIDQLGRTSARSLGLSKNAAIGAAASFGDLFQTVGLAEETAADMSVELVGLSADLASFHNAAGGAEEVLGALRSGLSGESEPMRRFGVFLSEAAVQAKAMQLGLVAAGGELTEAQKIQARYAIILEQTTTAQGDFARTADGLANKQRTANALYEDAKAKIGKGLLPVQLQLTNAMIDMLPTLEGVAKAMSLIAGTEVGRALSISVVAAIVATKGMRELRETMEEFGVSSGKASKATRILSKGLLALGAATAIHNLFDQGSADLERFTEKAEAFGGSEIDQRIQALNKALEEQNKIASGGVAIGVSGVLQFYSSEKARDAADRVDAIKERLKELHHEQELSRIESEAGAHTTAGVAKATEEYEAELEELNEELDKAWAKQQRLNGVALDAVEAQIQFRDTLADGVDRIKDAAKAGEDHARSLSLQNQAGRDNVSWLTEAIRGANDHAESVLHQTGSVEKANKVLREDVSELRSAAKAAGLNRDQVEQLVRSYLKVPKKSETKIEQPGMTKAKTDADSLKTKMEQVDGTFTSKVSVTVTGLGLLGTLRERIRDIVGTFNTRLNVSDAFERRQHGGPTQWNRPYLVGEAGAEILYKGRVYPSGKTPPALTQATPAMQIRDIHYHVHAPNQETVLALKRMRDRDRMVRLRATA